jgi:tellurite resistance protein
MSARHDSIHASAARLSPATAPPNNRGVAITAAMFSIVLGLSGLGQAWRVAARLWRAPPVIGEAIIWIAVAIWGGLLLAYLWHAAIAPERTTDEYRHPVVGGTPALLGIATVLISQALIAYSRPVAWALALVGVCWHLMFSVWHTGTLWKGGRQPADTAPTLYLPTVAGNFTSAAALGALGQPDWAWLLLGIGVLSWLALEPLVIGRLWHGESLPVSQRASLGIQFAPPVVCASALLVIAPDTPPRLLLILLGYGLFQLLIGLRLAVWLREQPFSYGWWAFSFGVVSATGTCLKLALAGVAATSVLALPVFVAANGFVGYLCVRTLLRLWGYVRFRLPSQLHA